MTPSSAKAELQSTRKTLGELHRTLLAVLKADRESQLGKTVAPTEWFQTLIAAAEYQWLKPINSLLSDVDALSDLGKASDSDLSILRSELEMLFFKDNDDVTSFNCHYRKLFHLHHDLMFMHGKLREAFAKLPNSKPPANAAEIRLGWHKIGASRRKLLN